MLLQDGRVCYSLLTRYNIYLSLSQRVTLGADPLTTVTLILKEILTRSFVQKKIR